LLSVLIIRIDITIVFYKSHTFRKESIEEYANYVVNSTKIICAATSNISCVMKSKPSTKTTRGNAGSYIGVTDDLEENAANLQRSILLLGRVHCGHAKRLCKHVRRWSGGVTHSESVNIRLSGFNELEITRQCQIN